MSKLLQGAGRSLEGLMDLLIEVKLLFFSGIGFFSAIFYILGVSPL